MPCVCVCVCVRESVCVGFEFMCDDSVYESVCGGVYIYVCFPECVCVCANRFPECVCVCVQSISLIPKPLQNTAARGHTKSHKGFVTVCVCVCVCVCVSVLTFVFN